MVLDRVQFRRPADRRGLAGDRRAYRHPDRPGRGAASCRGHGLGPRGGNDPQVLAQRAEIEYGAQLVLYPAPGGDHSALARCWPGWPMTGSRRLVISRPPGRRAGGAGQPCPPPSLRCRWRGCQPRSRWSISPAGPRSWPGGLVGSRPAGGLVGVTAWGGAGKTALVTHWVQEAGGGQAARGAGGVRVELLRRPLRRTLGRGAAGVGAGRTRDRGTGTGRAAGRCWRCCGRCRCCWCWTGWRWCRKVRPGKGSVGCWTACCVRCWPAPASAPTAGWSC